MIARGDLPPGGRPGRQRRHRVPHRRRPPSRPRRWPGTRRCCAASRQRFPKAHLKAFTAIEIGWFAKREKLSIEEVLRRLRAAGLGSLPGGGAEIFHPEVREIICDGKLDADEWIEVHRVAHRHGHQEQLHDALRPRREAGAPGRPPAAPARTCRTRRAASTPSSRSPTTPRTTTWGCKYHTTGPRRPAPHRHGRLVLDNIPHIKAYWVMVTPKLAQVALSLRRRRPRRHGGARRRSTTWPGAETAQMMPTRRARAGRARGRLRTGRARHALQSGRAARP